MNITSSEYWTEVSELAENILADAMQDNNNDIEAAEGEIYDTRLHQTIDGHQWVLYNAYHLDIISHSDNEDYMVDNFGGDCLEHALKEGGLSGLHMAIAVWAFYADVSDKLIDAIQAARDEAEEAEEADEADEADDSIEAIKARVNKAAAESEGK